MIEIEQQCFLYKKKRGPSHRIKPFESNCGIANRGYSKRCQQLMTDFGIEESFAKATARMKEHHGVDVSPTTVRRFTEMHAERVQQIQVPKNKQQKESKRVIVEMDGEMVPLVDTSEGEGDRRKTRQCSWSELRLGTAKRVDEVEWKYAVSFGSSNELGDRMTELLEKEFDWQGETKLYGIGDGAKWIVEQLERIAGSQYWYVIDLYHLCEYLGGAASAWTTEKEKAVKELKERLKTGKNQEVLRDLKKCADRERDHEGLRKCIQYMENRPGQFDYEGALKEELPIGSGKIESSHRHVIQARLKKAGAWWKRENAAAMAELRVFRANGYWKYLWQDQNEEDILQSAA